MKDILKRNTFWMMLVLALSFTFIWEAPPTIETWNLNQTIDWGNHSFISTKYFQAVWEIAYYSIPIFFMGYTALLITKRETKIVLSIFHFFFITFTLPLSSDIIDLTILMLFFSWCTFILNVLLSEKVGEI